MVRKGSEKGFFFKFFLSPALLNIRMNYYFRLFTRLRRIRVKKKVFVESYSKDS